MTSGTNVATRSVDVHITYHAYHLNWWCLSTRIHEFPADRIAVPEYSVGQALSHDYHLWSICVIAFFEHSASQDWYS